MPHKISGTDECYGSHLFLVSPSICLSVHMLFLLGACKSFQFILEPLSITVIVLLYQSLYKYLKGFLNPSRVKWVQVKRFFLRKGENNFVCFSYMFYMKNKPKFVEHNFCLVETVRLYVVKRAGLAFFVNAPIHTSIITPWTTKNTIIHRPLLNEQIYSTYI